MSRRDIGKSSATLEAELERYKGYRRRLVEAGAEPVGTREHIEDLKRRIAVLKARGS